MKKLALLLLPFLFFCCKDIRSRKSFNELSDSTVIDNIEVKDTLTIVLPEQLKQSIKEKGKLWLKSWNENNSSINLDEFTQEFNKPFDFEWEDYNKKEFLTLSEFTKKSSSGWVADLYSYHTVMEDGQEISFGIDQKVYIYTDSKIIDLLTLGSDEFIEDAFWLNESQELILLGYYNDNKVIPIIWLFNFVNKKQIRYQYNSLNKEERGIYFTKYLLGIR